MCGCLYAWDTHPSFSVLFHKLWSVELFSPVEFILYSWSLFGKEAYRAVSCYYFFWECWYACSKLLLRLKVLRKRPKMRYSKEPTWRKVIHLFTSKYTLGGNFEFPGNGTKILKVTEEIKSFTTFFLHWASPGISWAQIRDAPRQFIPLSFTAAKLGHQGHAFSIIATRLQKWSRTSPFLRPNMQRYFFVTFSYIFELNFPIHARDLCLPKWYVFQSTKCVHMFHIRVNVFTFISTNHSLLLCSRFLSSKSTTDSSP